MRTFKRLPEGQRGDKDLLRAVVGSPWAPVPGGAETDEIPVMIRVDAAAVVLEAQLPAALPARQPNLGRRVYIRRAKELEKCGFTDHCPGCVAAALGGQAQEHSDECRKRITDLMSADPVDKDRVVEGGKRVQERGQRGRKTRQLELDMEGSDVVMQSDAPATGAGGASSSGLERAPAAGAPGAASAPEAAPMADAEMERDVAEIHLLLMSLGMGTDAVDVMEVFCLGRLREHALVFGLVRGGAFDLRGGWDLNDPTQVAECKRLIREMQPLLLLGSPKCAPFSVLQRLNKGSEEYERKLRKGINHLNLVMQLYIEQVEAERLFLHEHPWSASS
jgi:hypothetical protein